MKAPQYSETGVLKDLKPDIVLTDYHCLPFHRVFIELLSKALNLGALGVILSQADEQSKHTATPPFPIRFEVRGLGPSLASLPTDIP